MRDGPRARALPVERADACANASEYRNRCEWFTLHVDAGAQVLVAVLVLATAFGVLRALRDGRFRGTHTVRGVSSGGTTDAGAADGGTTAPGDADSGTTDPGDPADPAPSVLAGTQWEQELGPRATLLQFSSAFCAPCRATRRVLEEVARIVPGVTHLEVDAEHHLDLVRRLGVTRTPTTLVLDAAGREASRATGAPSRTAVVATLGRVL